MGILAGLKHWMENAGTPDQQTGLSGWDKLGAVGAGLQNIGDPEGGDRLAPYKAQAAKTAVTTQRAQQIAMNDEIAQRVGIDPKARLLGRVDPEKFAEYLRNFLSPQVVGNDSSVSAGGEFSRPESFKTINDQVVKIPGSAPAQVPGMDGFRPIPTVNALGEQQQLGDQPQKAQPFNPNPAAVFTAAPSYSDETARMTATKPDFQKVGLDETLVQVPGSGPDPSQTPRGIRNNNPGNIEDGEFAKSIPGYKGSDGRFAIFDSPQAGQGAHVALLGNYGRKGINTISAVINRWAPQSDGNDTGAYASYVAKKLGLDPNAPIDLTNPQVAQKVASAMGEFENGPQSASKGGVSVAFQGAPKPVVEKPLPAGVSSKEDADLEALSGVSNVNAQLDNILGQLESGALNLGPVKNLLSATQNAAGMSNESSRNFSALRSTLETIRNASLRLNSGVQTEGDAQRAWNELLPNLNDPKLVKQQLQRIKSLNARAADAKRGLVNVRRARYGVEPLSPEELGAVTPAGMPQATQAADPPKLGQVQNGYMFMGGNPGDKSRWRKL